MRSREEGEGEPDTFTAAPLASRWRDTALQVAESREAGRGTWGTHLERLLTGEREAGSGGEWRDSVRGRGGDCVWSDADGSERVFAAGLRRQTASAEVEEAVHDPLLHPREEEDEEAGRQGSEGDALRAGRTSAAVLERPPSKTKSRAVDGEHDRSRHVFGRESPCSAVDTSADGAEAADEGAHQSRDAGDDYTVTAAGASLPDESKALIPVAAKDRRVARRTIDRMQRWGVVVRDTALERMQRQRQHPMQTRPQEPSSSTENMEEMSPSSGVESDGLRVEVARTLLESLASGAPLWDAVATATATSVELASVRRHYSDFAWLEQRLVATHPVCIVPALPDAPRWLERYTSTADLYLERQRRRLERFLLRVLAHPVLQRDRQLHAFLGCFGDAVWARLRACQDGRQIEAVLDEANEALREEVAMDSTVRGAHTAGAADPGAALAGTASRSYLQWATHGLWKARKRLDRSINRLLAGNGAAEHTYYGGGVMDEQQRVQEERQRRLQRYAQRLHETTLALVEELAAVTRTGMEWAGQRGEAAASFTALAAVEPPVERAAAVEPEEGQVRAGRSAPNVLAGALQSLAECLLLEASLFGAPSAGHPRPESETESEASISRGRDTALPATAPASRTVWTWTSLQECLFDWSCLARGLQRALQEYAESQSLYLHALERWLRARDRLEQWLQRLPAGVPASPPPPSSGNDDDDAASPPTSRQLLGALLDHPAARDERAAEAQLALARKHYERVSSVFGAELRRFRAQIHEELRAEMRRCAAAHAHAHARAAQTWKTMYERM
ncbi:hypothetical protein CDCA_CDCA12G3368 [Cyanidium caldarium]|uniref:PX domain-containing protein n=1 Tax=Cyanidium caldarium TaxID=2771 RepID=A0AAV9IYG0_CYACA|nr:hypothetical protein CDCA_CDCA12G3368 [Cyanidium caldarium]